MDEISISARQLLSMIMFRLRDLFHGGTSRSKQPWRMMDRLITAHWWWQLRLKFAERNLERVLEAHGENSIFARRSLVEWQKVRFAYLYGRTASADVRKVVGAVAAIGNVPPSALWTLVINHDIRSTRDGVRVRHGWWAKPLMHAAQVMTLMAFLNLAIYTMIIPGALWMKCLILIGLALFFGSISGVWHLYTARPLATIARYGDAIDRIARQIELGNK